LFLLKNLVMTPPCDWPGAFRFTRQAMGSHHKNLIRTADFICLQVAADFADQPGSSLSHSAESAF
jgi:hypothetical protein